MFQDSIGEKKKEMRREKERKQEKYISDIEREGFIKAKEMYKERAHQLMLNETNFSKKNPLQDGQGGGPTSNKQTPRTQIPIEEPKNPLEQKLMNMHY